MLGRIATALDVAILELLPPNRNGNGHVDAADGPYWEELLQNFSLLSPEEMSRALFFARSLADQNEQRGLIPELVAS
jgi:hypothetical protein